MVHARAAWFTRQTRPHPDTDVRIWSIASEMARPGPLLLSAILVAACGGQTKQGGTTPEGGGGGSGSCEPGRCLDDISRTIADYRTQTRACYDAGRKRRPGLAGQLVINFEIDAEGNVVDTRQGMQDGQLEDEGVVSCVSDVVKTIKFAKSAAGKSTRGYHRFEWAAR
jgi:hypothetical protein